MIGNAIVNKICVFAAGDDAVIAKDGKMLRDITVGGLDIGQEITDRELFFSEQTEDFKSYRMGHRLKEAGYINNLLVIHVYPRVAFDNLT